MLKTSAKKTKGLFRSNSQTKMICKFQSSQINFLTGYSVDLFRNRRGFTTRRAFYFNLRLRSEQTLKPIRTCSFYRTNEPKKPANIGAYLDGSKENDPIFPRGKWNVKYLESLVAYSQHLDKQIRVHCRYMVQLYFLLFMLKFRNYYCVSFSLYNIIHWLPIHYTNPAVQFIEPNEPLISTKHPSGIAQ